MNKASAQQIAEIESFDQLKEDFLSTISHELRSPVTNIKVAIRLLRLLLQQDESDKNYSTQSPIAQKQTAFEAKVDHYLLIVEQECDREMDLLNNFLDLQQLDAGNYRLTQTAVHLQEIIPQVIKPFLNRAANQQQTLQLEIATNLPVLIIDQNSLERILTELLCNACKFTPVGGAIVVRLSLETTSTKALNNFQLNVTNSGIEIPTSEYSRIFERFYRIPKDDRWKYGGTGLGLTLVKELTEHLGGSIQVESEAGQTCFTVEIPINS
ncbi:MAG: hypothetical protein Kow00121_62920 [Elainellaceae cyanobacterium]